MPLPYQPENNEIPVQTPPTGFDALRTVAVSRIYLVNFDHITAYWVGLGLKLAQVALSYGSPVIHTLKPGLDEFACGNWRARRDA